MLKLLGVNYQTQHIQYYYDKLRYSKAVKSPSSVRHIQFNSISYKQTTSHGSGIKKLKKRINANKKKSTELWRKQSNEHINNSVNIALI